MHAPARTYGLVWKHWRTDDRACDAPPAHAKSLIAAKQKNSTHFEP